MILSASIKDGLMKLFFNIPIIKKLNQLYNIYGGWTVFRQVSSYFYFLHILIDVEKVL